MIHDDPQHFTNSVVEHSFYDFKCLILPLLLENFDRDIDQNALHLDQLAVLLQRLLVDQILQLCLNRVSIDGVRTHEEQAVAQDGIEKVLGV